MDAQLFEAEIRRKAWVLGIELLTIGGSASEKLHIQLSHHRSVSVEHYILGVF